MPQNPRFEELVREFMAGGYDELSAREAAAIELGEHGGCTHPRAL